MGRKPRSIRSRECVIMDDRIDAKLDKILDKLSEHSEVLARHGVIHEQNHKELAQT